MCIQGPKLVQTGCNCLFFCVCAVEWGVCMCACGCMQEAGGAVCMREGQGMPGEGSCVHSGPETGPNRAFPMY